MRILLPVHYFTDEPQSGLHTELWNFPSHLAAAGHEVFVVTLAADLVHETKKSLREKNIRLYRLYNYKGHGLGYAESLMVFLFSVLLRLRYHFDWIFVPDAAKTPFSHFKLGARYAGRIFSPDTQEMEDFFNSGDWSYDRKRKDEAEGIDKTKKPLLYRFFFFFSYRIWFRLFPVHHIAENADILFCQGLEPLDFARQAGRKNPVYLPNVVQRAWFDNLGDNRIDTSGKFIFLFVGRILKSKGIFNLIPVFKKLSASYPNLELWVVGPGHGIYAEMLERAVGGFEDKIKIFGQKNREEVAMYIKSCHVVVDPFIYASFSTVVLEALYCKKPVIAPRMGDTKDVVKEGVTGYLADSRNPEELKEKMEQCVKDYPAAEGMALAGYEFVKNYVTTENMARILDVNFRSISEPEKALRANREFESLFR